jgi:hypothetical protein
MSLDDWSKIAQIVATLISAGALVFAAMQFYEANKNHKQNNAIQIWRDYEKYSMEHVDLSLFADSGSFDFSGMQINGYRNNFEKYEWYVSFMLWACEDISKAFSDPDWRHVIDEQLKRHRTFLKSDYFRGRDSFQKKTYDMLSSDFQRLLDRAIQ